MPLKKTLFETLKLHHILFWDNESDGDSDSEGEIQVSLLKWTSLQCSLVKFSAVKVCAVQCIAV